MGAGAEGGYVGARVWGARNVESAEELGYWEGEFGGGHQIVGGERVDWALRWDWGVWEGGEGTRKLGR